MPKEKTETKKSGRPSEEEKVAEIDPEEKVVDTELISSEENMDELEEEDAILDAEEVDPFKDKWEE